MLKNGFRRTIGFFTIAPFILAIRVLTSLIGAQRAEAVVGPMMTAVAKLSLKLSVPKIQPGDDFSIFVTGMKRSLWLWKLVFDVEIAEESAERLELRIANCPFCEALAACDESRLSPYVCRGDWAFAAENTARWGFERHHEIGNGATFCDHTYKRLPRTAEQG